MGAVGIKINACSIVLTQGIQQQPCVANNMAHTGSWEYTS